MRQNLQVLFLFVSMTVAACASQSTSSGGGGAPDVKVLNGCRVDAGRICDSLRGQTVTMSGTGLEADSRMVEQDSARTASIVVPVKKPNGDEIFEVECGINALHQSVSWAYIKAGPPVTDDDAQYLRTHGYCSEP
jgi:hypothetical protein